MVAATLMAALVTTTSCGNSNKQSQSEKTEQAAPAALSIDNLLVHADSLANKEVTIEGICTHTCKPCSYTHLDVYKRQHQAFFTKEAMTNIAHTTLQNVKDFAESRSLVNEVAVGRV